MRLAWLESSYMDVQQLPELQFSILLNIDVVQKYGQVL